MERRIGAEEAGPERPAPDENARLRRQATWASLAAAVLLLAVKLGGWLITGSVALLAAALDSIVDIGASLVTFLGVRYAERPADREHRYGHGKGEALAAFVQALFLVAAAFALAQQAIARLIDPQPLTDLEIGLGVVIGTLAVTSLLVAFQDYVVRRTGSTAIAADRAHYASDIQVNVALLLALGLTRWTGWTRFDALCGFGIAVYVVWSAWKVTRDALELLLDRELSREDRDRIRTVVLACPDVRGMHDLRTRNAGDRVFVEFHVEVDGRLTVERGHEIGDAAERAVEALFPGGAEVLAHLEPAGIEDERLDSRVQRVP